MPFPIFPFTLLPPPIYIPRPNTISDISIHTTTTSNIYTTSKYHHLQHACYDQIAPPTFPFTLPLHPIYIPRPNTISDISIHTTTTSNVYTTSKHHHLQYTYYVRIAPLTFLFTLPPPPIHMPRPNTISDISIYINTISNIYATSKYYHLQHVYCVRILPPTFPLTLLLPLMHVPRPNTISKISIHTTTTSNIYTTFKYNHLQHTHHVQILPPIFPFTLLLPPIYILHLNTTTSNMHATTDISICTTTTLPYL